MGGLAGMFGLAGGSNGTGFSTTNPVTQNQINNAYQGTQNSLQSQQALLNALQGQGALQNQNQVYGQLQGVANGTGPNPAQAMLNQSTGANVANQAALMAGQRGASANAGLMARQAAQQGGALQQQAVGQGATMQANQSLNALSAAGNMANTQAGNLVGQTNATTAANQAQQNSLLGAQAGYNSLQAGLEGAGMQQQSGVIGGLFGGAGAMLGAGAEGGMPGDMPKMMAAGGDSSGSSFGNFLSGFGNGMGSQNASNPLASGMSSFGGGLKSLFSSQPQSQAPQGPSAMDLNGMQQAKISGASPMDLNGIAQANGIQSNQYAHGGPTDYRKGGAVKAKSQDQKAVVDGNSYANDKIPAMLSEHEIVIPRNVIQSADPVNGAAQFVAATLAKKRVGAKK